MAKSDIVEFLRKVPLFDDLEEEELEEVANVVIGARYPDDEVIFREKDVGDVLYVIASGAVKITKYTKRGEERIIATLSPCDHFGEMALLEDDKRSASAIAVGRTELLEIHRNDLEAMAGMNHTTGYKVMRNLAFILSQRLRKTDNDFVEIFSKPYKSIKELEEILDNAKRAYLSFGWSFEEDSGDSAAAD